MKEYYIENDEKKANVDMEGEEEEFTNCVASSENSYAALSSSYSYCLVRGTELVAVEFRVVVSSSDLFLLIDWRTTMVCYLGHHQPSSMALLTIVSIVHIQQIILINLKVLFFFFFILIIIFKLNILSLQK